MAFVMQLCVCLLAIAMVRGHVQSGEALRARCALACSAPNLSPAGNGEKNYERAE